MFDYIYTINGMEPLGKIVIHGIIRTKDGTAFWDASRNITCFVCVNKRGDGNERRYHFIEKIRQLDGSGVNVTDCAFGPKVAFPNMFQIRKLKPDKYETT